MALGREDLRKLTEPRIPIRKYIEREDIQLIFISFFIILLGTIFSSNSVISFPTGFATYRAAGYTPFLANIHITFIAIALTMAIISTYLAIKAIRRFTEGHIRAYVKWTRLGEVCLAIFLVNFFIVEVTAFYFESSIRNVRYFDTIGLVALIFAFVCYIKASYQLDKMSKVYGFASPDESRDSAAKKFGAFMTRRNADQKADKKEEELNKSERSRPGKDRKER